MLLVGVAGFEPTTPCSQSRCANRTALHPVVPDPDPVIGLVQPHGVVVCQSRAFPAGGTFRIPGCKDNRFFLFRQTFSPKSTVPGGAPDSGCVSCRFACRTFFAALVSGFGAAFCRCPDVFLSLSLSLSLFQSLLPFLYLFRIPVFYSSVACSGFPVLLPPRIYSASIRMRYLPEDWQSRCVPLRPGGRGAPHFPGRFLLFLRPPRPDRPLRYVLFRQTGDLSPNFRRSCAACRGCRLAAPGCFCRFCRTTCCGRYPCRFACTFSYH